VALRGADLDVQFRELSVKRQLLVVDGVVVVVWVAPPKSAAGVRTLQTRHLLGPGFADPDTRRVAPGASIKGKRT
jgi:hypothetical protein